MGESYVKGVDRCGTFKDSCSCRGYLSGVRSLVGADRRGERGPATYGGRREGWDLVDLSAAKGPSAGLRIVQAALGKVETSDPHDGEPNRNGPVWGHVPSPKAGGARES